MTQELTTIGHCMAFMSVCPTQMICFGSIVISLCVCLSQDVMFIVFTLLQFLPQTLMGIKSFVEFSLIPFELNYFYHNVFGEFFILF